MGDRGRKPASELATIASLPVHLAPPGDLTEEQAAIWDDAVRSMEAGFFKAEHRPSLEAYCRHVSRERNLSARLAELDPIGDQADYKLIRDWADKESAKLLAHARSLRLTPQSRYDAQKAARTNLKAGKVLWE